MDECYEGHEAAVMIETIEHVAMSRLPEIERKTIGVIQPSMVVVTTPDATKRLTSEKMLQRGHLFEWDIPEFVDWTSGVCRAYPYTPEVMQLNGPTFVRGTQIALFRNNRIS